MGELKGETRPEGRPSQIVAHKANRLKFPSPKKGFAKKPLTDSALKAHLGPQRPRPALGALTREPLWLFALGGRRE
jgi:hypothetical protein